MIFKKGVPINDVRRGDKGKWTPARVAHDAMLLAAGCTA